MQLESQDLKASVNHREPKVHFEHPKNLHVIYGVNYWIEYLSTDVLTRIYGDWMTRMEYVSLLVEVGLKSSVLPSLLYTG